MKTYYLPAATGSKYGKVAGDLRESFSQCTVPQLVEIADCLIAAQEKLSSESIENILNWIAQTASRWRDSNDPIRREAEEMLPKVCGLSQEMVRVVLDDLFGQLTAKSLKRLLEAELGNPKVLDGFSSDKNRSGKKRAFGPRLITQVLPANVLGVSVVSLVLGLMAKSSNLLRVSYKERLLTALFAQSLETVWPEMGNTMAVLTWEKGRTDLSKEAFKKADCVVAFGNNETLASLRSLIPVSTKTIFYGHKLSLGVISRECAGAQLAEKAALDIALFEQQGCLSPHVYYVESGGTMTPDDFAREVAEALRGSSQKWPNRNVPLDDASRIQQLRGALPLKGGAVFQSDEGVEWTVLVDPDPVFRFSPLFRTIWIKPVDDLAAVIPQLLPVRDMIQAIGMAIPREREEHLVNRFSSLGGCRICAIGKMQQPPINWYHDGNFRLLPLLRFVDWETA